MKNIRGTFKATLISFNSVEVKSAYVGEHGFIEAYWFELNLRDGFTKILPYILDYTYELWEAKNEYWTLTQPLRSYKNSSDKELIGTTCRVSAITDDEGFPISIDFILSKNNK
ncbi:MAG: hypothetical protein ACOY3M_00405 [Patescibacteria group bacterium]